MIRRLVLACPLLMVALSVAPAAAQPASPVGAAAGAPMSAAERTALIGAIDRTMRTQYVFPQKVPAIIAGLKANDRAGRYAGTRDQVGDRLGEDLAKLAGDKHLKVHYFAEGVPPMGDAVPSAAEQAAQLAEERAANFGIDKLEILDGNIGYLRITHFPDAVSAARVIEAAMAFVGNSDALIVDLRANHGGEPATVGLVASYLLPADSHINDIYFRKGDVTRQYWAVPIAADRRIAAKVPMYVLTDARTGSGGEELAYDLQQLKRATLIGQSTWGGANPGEGVALTKDFAMFVPSGRAINPVTKTNWEGVGVQPDIALPIAADPLAKAIELAKAATGRK